MLEKQRKKYRRHCKIRAKIIGSKKRPRFSVFRSNQHIYAQLIDDEEGKTLVSVSDLKLKKNIKKMEMSSEIGKLIAEKALEKKIKEVVFDRGGYKYHGRIKAVAEAARKGGLKF